MFITLEGIDGSGKSTQRKRLAEWLRARGHDVIETREPGGSPGAEAIRGLLVSGDPDAWSPETEILLFTAARRDHCEKLIRPQLDRGAVVLCDRYIDSTRCYQGERRRLVDELHDRMIGLNPDLTLIFDIDPEHSLQRAAARGGAEDGDAEDRFEKRGLAFQKTLRERFRAIAAAEPFRAALIDAAGSEMAVFDRVAQAVRERLNG